MSRSPPSANSNSLLNRFQNWGAVICAFCLTFLFHPFAYQGSAGFLLAFSQQHYPVLAWLVPALWWLGSFIGLLILMGVIIRVLLMGGVMQLIRRVS